jgi:hypothetical protein
VPAVGNQNGSIGVYLTVSPKRKLLLAIGVLGVAAATFVLVWFQPQKVVVEKRVDEAAPAARRAVQKDDLLASGSFRELTHPTAGKAKVIRSGGKTYLRFEDFRTSNGPDVVVYLSAGDIDGPNRALADDFIHLGPLKGNIGDQNYLIPPGTDLGKYHTAVVWCRRFTVAFAAAELV